MCNKVCRLSDTIPNNSCNYLNILTMEYRVNMKYDKNNLGSVH